MSYQAEIQLLATILNHGATPDAVEVMDSLTPDMFTSNQTRPVFEELKAMSHLAIPINMGMLMGRNFDLYNIASNYLGEATSKTATKRLGGLIKASHSARGVLNAIKQVEINLQRDPLALEASLSALSETINSVDLSSEQSEPVRLYDYASGYIDLLEKRMNGDKDALGIDLGIDMPVNRTDLIVLGGQPAMGKTALALYMLNHVAQSGATCLKFSLEMEGMQIFEREVSKHGRISSKELKSPINGNWEATHAKVGKAITEIHSKNVYIDDSPYLDIFTFKSKCKRFKANHPELDLIVIDYLTLMAIPEGQSRALSVGEVSRQLKLFAKEIKVPILLLSQLNRDAAKNKREPEPSDLRDSGAIEQDADKIIFPYREEVHDPNSPNKGLAKVLKKKVRDGEVGAHLLKFEYGNFYDAGGLVWHERVDTKENNDHGGFK